jgi:hypothetical protein
MGKLTLTNVTRKTAGGLRIDRKCEHDVAIGYGGVGNILTYTLVGTPTDINSAVLEMMTMAAQDVLDLSKPMFKGDFTAKELAGRLSGCADIVWLFTNEHYVDYKRICIECGTFKCQYEAKDVFVMLSEWEGMMGIPQNKAHKFPCEAEREMDKDNIAFKPYKCSRGYRPRHIAIYDADTERIARKYAVLGPLAKSLTEEGMKRAFSVASVISEYDGHPLHDIAQTVLSKKLHDDYGVKDTQLVRFDRSAFRYAPECWIVEDRAYMQELRDFFNGVTAEYPAPDWKRGDFVQLKNQKLTQKKWQGKLKVDYMEPRYELFRIRWYVRLSTTKGKWDTVCYLADWLEAYSEPAPEREAKKTIQNSKIQNSKLKQADGTIKLKGSEYTVKDDAGKDVVFASYVPKAQSAEHTEKTEHTEALPITGERGEGLSFAELLRKVLLAA